MPLPVSAPFTASLLMARDAACDLPGLIATLGGVLGPDGLSVARAESRDGLLVTAGRMHLLVAGRDGRLPEAQLETARASRLGAFIGEDWEPAIAAHRGALTLSAGIGPAPDAPRDLAPAHDQELTDLRLRALHVATSYLAAETAPLAVHWRQCDQLFLPDRFLAAADMLFPLPIFLHPVPFGSAQADGRHACPGFDLRGAETLVGRKLRFAEAPAPLDWLFARACALVAHLRAAGEVPADGDTFGTAEGERITVSHGAGGALVLSVTERDGGPVVPPGS